MTAVFDIEIEISEYPFSRSSRPEIANNPWVRNQWPLVYFLQNEKKRIAYVGESTNALLRMDSHWSSDLRKDLQKLSIIASDKFNKSVTLDIESWLIQNLAAERTLKLQNANNGLLNRNYYQRSLYRSAFDKIWEQLLKKKVVTQTLREIQNTNLFKYSPYKSLNTDQFSSVLQILEHLNDDQTEQLFVTGNAGTGKTILATYYLIKLLNTPYRHLNAEGLDSDAYRELQLMETFSKKFPSPRIGLVVAMSSLHGTLREVFDAVPGLSASMVIKPADTFKKPYDILIVDEAHRLRQRKNISWQGVFIQNNKKLGLGDEGTELDWIIANSRKQIFFYDADQTIKISDVPGHRFSALMGRERSATMRLTSQMRVLGGEDYISFVDDLLNCRLKPGKRFRSADYDLKIYDSLVQLSDDLAEKEKEHQLCRLIAGYSWHWQTQDNPDESAFDVEIEGKTFKWNSEVTNWVHSANAAREMGSIHTTQGTDLNYAGIIFGKEIRYNPQTRQIEIAREHYHDRNGKADTSDEMLKQFIVNIYKNMLYRGISGTYLYAVDANLRDYFEQFIPHVPARKRPEIMEIGNVEPFKNAIPLYDIQAAAGAFSDLQQASDFQWTKVPAGYRASADLFICQVTGESMNKRIPNGSWCLFRKDPGGSREGKIVLVQHRQIQDPDFGAGYTVKQYHSTKAAGVDGEWTHESITLKPLSSDARFREIVLTADETIDLKVLGVLVKVLDEQAN